MAIFGVETYYDCITTGLEITFDNQPISGQYCAMTG